MKESNGKRRRYLLDGKTLRQVQTHLAQIPLGDAHEMVRFLERSCQQRNRTRLAEVMLSVLVVGMITTWWWFDTQRRHKNDLSAWALPRDLYTYQRQLITLHTTAPVSHLRWLSAELTSLKIGASVLQDLTMLPPTLTVLDMSGPGLTSLAGLEKLPQLTTLDLSYTGTTSIKTLSSSHSLKTLYLSKEVYSLDGLPTSVNHLVLR